MPLQNELIKACENGSLAKVKAAIGKGASVDLPNEQGKNPLYCAVYGMNPDVVQYLIKQRDKDAPATSWSACEAHNQKQYGQTFLIMKFAPVYYKDWYELLLKIEPNEFLAGYHLAQCQKVWGVNDKDCGVSMRLSVLLVDGEGSRWVGCVRGVWRVWRDALIRVTSIVGVVVIEIKSSWTWRDYRSRKRISR